MAPWVQLCAFGADGVGIDDIPEALTEYDTPAADWYTLRFAQPERAGE